MHNCQSNRETLIALALDQAQSGQTRSLPAETEACPACREEYAATLNAMRIAHQVKDSALPVESFWPGYRARLRHNLEAGSTSRAHALRTRTSFGTLLRNLFTSSVRIPIPLAAAGLIIVGVSIVFAWNSRRAVRAPAPIVVTKTVEVPVIQETTRDKIINRIVYRDRDRRQTLPARTNEIAIQRTAQAPISLVGFKPTNEVKLTIIKGNGRDEK